MKNYLVTFWIGEDLVFSTSIKAESVEQAREATEFAPYFWGIEYERQEVM